MKTVYHRADLCVIGGGLAGISAAIAAARRGAKVLLMHDRPVLGGNASSEVRMWICGAHGPNNRETGILEEISLENLYRNPSWNYSIWDSILFEKVRFQENLELLLNCTCNDLTMDGDRIRSVKGWQLTSETWHIIEANLFADCSGDSILAPLSSAEFRMGREASREFGEPIEPDEADAKTMGMSCLIQARETDRPQKYIPPAWAHRYETDADLPNRSHDHRWTNFWWMEVGGEAHSIYDTEELRDELLKIAFGVWDHVKNRGDHGAERWALEWVGFLPGKRESRRYVGDHMLTQKEVEAEGRFDDLVAYGGWSMDDHHPGGMAWPGQPTIFHPAPSPFGIPYRCLYSRKVVNLFCAGRNISATHAAMSATRVMATCATLGQAVGTAAAIAVRDGLTPRGVYEHRIQELQQNLMDDDCYLPWHSRHISDLTAKAELSAATGDAEPLRNGTDRPVSGEDNGWTGAVGDWVEYRFSSAEQISEVRLVFDSDLNRKEHNMPCNYPLDQRDAEVPSSMVKDFRIDILNGSGEWETAARVSDNYRRMVRIPLKTAACALRLYFESTWGSEKVHIFAFDIN